MEILGANIRTVISDFFSGIEKRLSLAHTAYITNGTYIPGRGVGGWSIVQFEIDQSANVN